jgi:predicted metal-binding membrane protein
LYAFPCAQVFRSTVEGYFDQMRIAHIVVFVITLAWAFVMWLWLVRPMLKHSGKESRQIAEMLSQLPPEMDVEGLVAQAIAKTGA